MKISDVIIDMHQGINTVADKVEYLDSGIPIIQSKNFTKGYLDLEDVRYLGEEDEKKYIEKYNPHVGDILMANIGTIGKSYVISEEQRFLIAWNAFLIKPNAEKVKSDFLKFYFDYLASTHYFDGLLTGGTVKFINKKKIGDINIPDKSLAEQSEICNVLSQVEKVIIQRQQEMELLDDLIKARFVEMFGDPVSNSYGLPEATLLELGVFGRGVSKHRPRNDPKLLGGEYPLIQTGDVANAGLYITSYNSTYSELGLKQSKMWNKGTLCITIAANIAKTAILEFDACFPDSVVGFTANEKTNNIFVHYWFSFFQAILEAQAPESAQKNINLKMLSELKVIVPEKEKQDEFVEFIKQVDKSKFISLIYIFNVFFGKENYYE